MEITPAQDLPVKGRRNAKLFRILRVPVQNGKVLVRDSLERVLHCVECGCFQHRTSDKLKEGRGKGGSDLVAMGSGEISIV